MKLTFTLSFLLCLLFWGVDSPVAHAQSMPWHPFPGGQLTLFNQGSSSYDGSYQALRVDSTRLEGADSAYYFFRSFRQVMSTDTVFDCQGIPLNQPLISAIFVDLDHRMGKKMLLRSDSVCAFVFSSGDTFLLKSQARIGESWPWGDSSTAIVDTILQQTVLGQADSVKVILISSGGKILLSKQFGIFQCLPFQPVLNYSGMPDTTSWYLWGIPGLAMGGHFPTFEERYFHQVGDVWQHTYTEGNLAAQTYNSGHYFQNAIVGVLPGSPYRYEREHQQLSWSPFGQVGPLIGPTIDTLTFDSVGYDAYAQLPGEWKLGAGLISGISSSSISYHGRFVENIISIGTIDTCANAMVFYDIKSRITGIMGEIYGHNWDGGDFDRMELTCYVLGADTWGTCLDLHALGNTDPINALECSVFPVPAKDAFYVSLTPGTVMESAFLVDANGRLVAEGKPEANTASIDVTQMPSGIYLLRVSDSEGHHSHRRIAVAR